ncbi:MAG TPA: LysE family translocator [Jatrophihabitans sp.]|uniref:LysE family translocator n=1 Tax=Jatrophihabitans sp. TaxID=1932789 RepID=UPI002E047445|nr:LysE family translocator [Jatrophihabitans sp.]
MTWSAYGSFLAFAVVLVLIPGPDFAVVTRNTLAGGRQRGVWSAVGVACSNTVQGVTAVAGLGAVIVHIEPLFQTVKWAGIAYLLVLGVQAFRSARRGEYVLVPAAGSDGSRARSRGFRQGFLSNITNPKVLVFYLAVLPQFLGRHAPVVTLLVFALSHAALSLTYLSTLVTGLSRARLLLARRSVRRGLDLATGTALIGFGARLATEQV